jgi:RecB family exonuclease
VELGTVDNRSIGGAQYVGPSRTLERLEYKLYPQSINAYYRCPRKFHFRYIRNLRMPFEFKSALVIGGVTHKVLAAIFRDRQDQRPPGDVETYVTKYIALEKYPEGQTDPLRIQHAPVVISHVKRALLALPADAEVLHVEEEFTYTVRTELIGAAVTVGARVDVVIQHGDGMVDHIDFKSGKQGGDPIQNYLSRLTVGKQLKLQPDRLRTVNVLTGSGSYEIVPDTRAANEHIWNIVQTQIHALSVDQEWQARPEPAICRICDYRSKCDYAQIDIDDD